jgi:predicted deacetylase
MDWSKFERFCRGITSIGGVGLLGVIPQCEDPTLLRISSPHANFWGEIRLLASQGWAIAQHGFRHVYDRKGRTFLGVTSPGEFVAHSADEQLRRVRAGQKILEANGLGTDIFMAPKHAFDESSLSALTRAGFRFITDGFGVWPYTVGGITLLPQLISRPHGARYGVYTTCFHLDNMTEAEIDQALQRLRTCEVVTFRQAVSISGPRVLSALARYATAAALIPRRSARLAADRRSAA